MAGSLVEVLQLLRYELNWLEQSGFASGPEIRIPSEGQSALSSSPFLCNRSCLNYQDPIQRHACHECALSMFVPLEHLNEDMPCHYIPLNGESIASLIEKGDKAQLASRLKSWLKATIARLEAVLEAQIGPS